MRQIDTLTISAMRDIIKSVDPDDDVLLTDMLTAETDAASICDELLDEIEICESHVLANKAVIDQRRERMSTLEARIEARKRALMTLLGAAGLRKWQRPAGTVSIRAVPPKPVVVDHEPLPDEYCTIVRKPNLMQIKADDYRGPGVTWTNGGETISIRRK